jgi:hypothetical protein
MQDIGGIDRFDVKHWKGVTVNKYGRVVKLILGSNNLSGDSSRIFDALSRLPFLEELDLRDNDIEGPIPPDFPSKLQHLKGVYLYCNRLTGEIPTQFAGLPSLTGIYLYNNKFSGKLLK